MTQTGFFVLAMIAVLVGLAYRILSLGSGAAKFRLLPLKWQQWFHTGHSSSSAGK